MTEDTIRQIKHLFMTYRNGIVADTLRKAGMPYKIIFGLQLPQISAIAKTLYNSSELALTLWSDQDIRESRLLACHLISPASLPEREAEKMAESVITKEEADILCFRVLRHTSYAHSLATKLSANSNPLISYCGSALFRNLEAQG